MNYSKAWSGIKVKLHSLDNEISILEMKLKCHVAEVETSYRLHKKGQEF